jgi:hypothetical protein
VVPPRPVQQPRAHTGKRDSGPDSPEQPWAVFPNPCWGHNASLERGSRKLLRLWAILSNFRDPHGIVEIDAPFDALLRQPFASRRLARPMYANLRFLPAGASECPWSLSEGARATEEWAWNTLADW